jgi:signal transduction histidine kinase
MIAVPKILKERLEQIILVMMLEMLHFATWYDFGDHLSQSLLIAHIGMFLIWQPVLEGDRQISWGKSLLFLAFTLAIIYWINWASITIWLVLLIGFVGGRVTTRRYERNVYMLVMAFLMFELIISAIPQMFDLKLNKTILNIFQIGLPLLPLILLITSNTLSKRANESVDILLATTISFMAIILALGSLVLMYHDNTDYLVALVESLIAIGLILIGISWLLSPHSGFSGLSQLWTKSLLNIGTPFERWLADLSEQRQEQDSAQDFLDVAMAELVSLPWIAGAKWSEGSTHEIYGEITKHEIHLTISDHPLTLFTHVPPAGVMSLHCSLLVQLVDTFYTAKKQEQELAQKAHLHAIYETGARVTHDIKNLLQSLQTMTTLLETTSDETREKSLTLLKRQLPHISQRLQLALNKLQAPEKETTNNVLASVWWEGLTTRKQDSNIRFNDNIKNDTLIPEELFNSVIENLLENAIHKRQVNPDIVITVTLITDVDSVVLSVTDTGLAIDENITKSILKEHVSSHNGHGIGLYQAAKQAESLNYSLKLEENSDGNVSFELSANI